MSDLRAILHHLAALRASRERGVLATLVKLEGSSYRSLGARMLIGRNGTLTGFLSAGCLEPDLVERARAVLETGQPAVVTYDTSAPDDIVWGLGLGCNGVLTILLEPTDSPSVERATAALQKCLETRAPGALAVVIASPSGCSVPLGCAQSYPAEVSPGLPPAVTNDLRSALSAPSNVRRYPAPGGEFEIFLEALRPPPAIFIYGAGADVPAVCRIARLLGWHVTVADRRSENTLRNVVPHADRVVSVEAHRLAGSEARLPDAAVLLMTHHFLTDKDALRVLLPLRLPYLGLLGSRKRKNELIDALRKEGYDPPADALNRLHTPIGLDIGAGAPGEIALAITAEVRAVLAGRNGGFLKDREAPIHVP